jgi:mannitol/fructose-specific phosphotransferase system IIA component (Ntr-type)
MDDPSQTIPVLIIFLLAVSEPNEYVQFLSKLAENFSKEEVIKIIYEETNPVTMTEILRGILKDKAEV